MIVEDDQGNSLSFRGGVCVQEAEKAAKLDLIQDIYNKAFDATDSFEEIDTSILVYLVGAICNDEEVDVSDFDSMVDFALLEMVLPPDHQAWEYIIRPKKEK